MKFTFIQWGFMAVFGFSITRLISLMMSRSIPRGRGLVWLGLWSFGLAMVLLPDLSFRLASILGVSRGTDAVVYSAIGFLSLLIFRSFSLLDTQDRQISELTTALAVKEWQDTFASEIQTGTENANRLV